MQAQHEVSRNRPDHLRCSRDHIKDGSIVGRKLYALVN
jgi:hypothetical protein